MFLYVQPIAGAVGGVDDVLPRALEGHDDGALPVATGGSDRVAKLVVPKLN